MFKKLTMASITLIGLSFFTLNTMAATTTQPGSMCVKWRSADPSPYLSASRIYNPSSTQWLRLDCPVVRTDFDSTFYDAGVEDSWIRAIDRHYSSDIRCQLISYSHNLNGTVSYWSTGNVYTSGSNTRPQQLNTNGESGENNVSHLYFSCHIPPTYSNRKSGLTTYKVWQ